MCHVLIIEDEPLVALDIEYLLRSEGATSVSFAASEEEAVSEAASCPPALITSDIKLLEGNGPSAVERIVRSLGRIPVIFVTGTPSVLESRNDDQCVLAKPFNARDMAQAFHQLMDAS